ncbi:MAG: tyrosine-protein phosphatase [Lachnospiraceae bacterium]|nr:tyrosine-protein phosphatase [Lachnospiraceae bacterium]
MTALVTPVSNETLDILTDRQREFLYEKEHSYDEHKIDWKHLERMSLKDHTFPQKHEFSWKTNEKEAILEISENKEFNPSFIVKTDAAEVMINNFKANCTYYWRVNNSESRCFSTEDITPRWIEVDGLTNVRDAGNWRTHYGSRIKQGMLFRGSEMDRHHTITAKGVQIMRNELKIKTDLDLRGEALNLSGSPLGGDVDLIVIPVSAYVDFMSEIGKRECKKLFDLFSEEARYPIYYHCWGGADRTGTVAFFMGAVLGMSETDLILDYELTSLAIWGDRNHKSELFKSFIKQINQYAGNTLQERAISFLYSCGITKEKMQKIRNILL